MSKEQPRSSDDTVNSRHVDLYIAELQEQLMDEMRQAGNTLYRAGLIRNSSFEEVDLDDSGVVRALKGFDLDESDRDKLATLLEFRWEAKPYARDWSSGVELINEDYFEKYAREYSDQVHLGSVAQWPYNHIDWEAAAEELKKSFTRVDFDGENFYVRTT